MIQQDFYEEYGFVSCFECDETFTDKAELAEHEKQHMEEEQWLKVALILLNVYVAFLNNY